MQRAKGEHRQLPEISDAVKGNFTMLLTTAAATAAAASCQFVALVFALYNAETCYETFKLILFFASANVAAIVELRSPASRESELAIKITIFQALVRPNPSLMPCCNSIYIYIYISASVSVSVSVLALSPSCSVCVCFT